MSLSKQDYILQQYLGGGGGNKKLGDDFEQKKVKQKKKKQKQEDLKRLEENNLQVKKFQDDEDKIDSDYQEKEEDKPQMIITDEKISQKDLQILLEKDQLQFKSKQFDKNQEQSQQKESISDSSSSSESSDSDAKIKRKKKRVRHDSMSDGEEENLKKNKKLSKEDKRAKKQMKTALGQQESEGNSSSSSSSKSSKQQQKYREQRGMQKTTMRDAEGKIIDVKEELENKVDMKKLLVEANQKQIDSYAKGMVQKKERLEQKEKIKNAAQGAFTNFNVSKEGEIEMINKKRFGDFMGKLIEKEDQQVIDQSLLKILKKCQFQPVSNRFNIQPGYRWDGVDRGNSFETKYYTALASNKDQENQKALENLIHL